MSLSTDQPEVKQIIGAMLFAAKTPLTLKKIRNVFSRTAKEYGDMAEAHAKVKEEDLKKALDELGEELRRSNLGIHLSEVANGYRIHNDKACGIWLRQMLERGKPQKLSKPALETLAIIAYRQPCTRAEIESVRGVSIDAMVRSLLELDLIKVVGRSELPGRPWLFGSTQTFLEHFGLNNLEDLPGVEDLKRRDEHVQERQPQDAPGDAAQDEDNAADADDDEEDEFDDEEDGEDEFIDDEDDDDDEDEDEEDNEATGKESKVNTTVSDDYVD